MILFFRVPVYTRSGSKEISERLRLKNWVERGGREELADRYGFSSIHYRGLAPGRLLRLNPEGGDPVSILYPRRKKALVPKGLAIRLELMAALEYIDKTDPNGRDDAFFVMIDGSGAFSFKNLFTILDPLMGAPRCEVVLGRRPPNNCGMPKWRQSIEGFEEFLLLERFGRRANSLLTPERRLPDSQAGAWGLRLSAMKSLPLTAREYGLEFDVAPSTLQSDLRFQFSNQLEMSERTRSEFGGPTINAEGVKTSIRKLAFIRHKLGITLDELIRSLERYQTASRKRRWPVLPKAYVKAVQGLSPL